MTGAERAEALAVLDRITADWPATTGLTRREYEQRYGLVDFTTRDGWVFTVCKRGHTCGDWNYIDTITAPDGRSWEYPFDEPEPYEVTAEDGEVEMVYPDRPLCYWHPVREEGDRKVYRGGWEHFETNEPARHEAWKRQVARLQVVFQRLIDAGKR